MASALSAAPYLLSVPTTPSDDRKQPFSKLTPQSPAAAQRTKAAPAAQAHPVEVVNYLFADYPMARVISNEPNCQMISDRFVITGYELYIVEQWPCSRKYVSCIATYTGKTDHKVTVAIVSVPADETLWSSNVHNCFNILSSMHMRTKDTSWGKMFVANLSGFPSNLNLVPVPAGDLRGAWTYFCVNENLRRTNCGGRLVLSIAPPYDASEGKFRQIFRTHDRVPITFSACEVVTLVQIGLFYFDLLEPQYVDGLLCDKTLKAVQTWWIKFAPFRYDNLRPKDGVFGPATVAGIIGFVTGARNRMASVVNYKVTKDPFDVAYFLESIRQFQKHEHLPKTMKLDAETVDRLYQITGRNFFSSPDFFGMVKTTMREVSGKQASTVSDAETLDLDKLKQALMGPRERYLWLGKGHMRSMSGGSRDLDNCGIPTSSLMPTELGSNRDLRKAMRRTDTAFRSGVTKLKNFQSRFDVANDSEDDTGDEGAPPSNSGLGLEYSRRRDKSGLFRSIMKSNTVARHGANMHNGANSAAERASSLELPCASGSDAGVAPERCTDPDAMPGDLIDLRRRASWSALPDSCTSLDWKNGSKTLCQDDDLRVRSHELRRQHSFGAVEQVLLRWELPFDYPEEKLLQSARRACHYHDQLVKEISMLETTTDDCKFARQSIETHLRCNHQTVEQLFAMKHKVSNRQKLLNISLGDTDALASRLQYELKTLESRIIDVEESVDSFEAKVSGIVARVDRLMAKQPNGRGRFHPRDDYSLGRSSSSWSQALGSWVQRLTAVFYGTGGSEPT